MEVWEAGVGFGVHFVRLGTVLAVRDGMSWVGMGPAGNWFWYEE